MKRILLAICGISVLWGCKETNPPLPVSSEHTDTTYVLPAAQIPAVQPHEILIEEFTGQTCANCPAAHSDLEKMAEDNPGRVNVVGLYIWGPGQSKPPDHALYDFRDSSATQVNTVVYNSKSDLPSGGVDRTKVSGQIILYQTDWPSAVATQLAQVDSVNIEILDSTIDLATMKAKIGVRVTYVNTVVMPQNLSIVVVEDSMVDLQEFKDSVHSGYTFTNVWRDMVTAAPLGDKLGTTDTKEPGRVFERYYTYAIKTTTPAINPAHMRVVAFVHNDGTGGNYRVAQSKQAKLILK